MDERRLERLSGWFTFVVAHPRNWPQKGEYAGTHYVICGRLLNTFTFRHGLECSISSSSP